MFRDFLQKTTQNCGTSPYVLTCEYLPEVLEGIVILKGVRLLGLNFEGNSNSVSPAVKNNLKPYVECTQKIECDAKVRFYIEGAGVG